MSSFWLVLKCLEGILEGESKALEDDCKSKLLSRLEMFRNAAAVSESVLSKSICKPRASNFDSIFIFLSFSVCTATGKHSPVVRSGGQFTLQALLPARTAQFRWIRFSLWVIVWPCDAPDDGIKKQVETATPLPSVLNAAFLFRLILPSPYCDCVTFELNQHIGSSKGGSSAKIV